MIPTSITGEEGMQMSEENLLQITYMRSSAFSGRDVFSALFSYANPVPRATQGGSAGFSWGTAQLLTGRVEVTRAQWREARARGYDLSPDRLGRVSTALKRLRLQLAPFEDPRLHVTDGHSGDLKIETGDVSLHLHWFLDPPPHFEGVGELIEAITIE